MIAYASMESHRGYNRRGHSFGPGCAAVASAAVGLPQLQSTVGVMRRVNGSKRATEVAGFGAAREVYGKNKNRL
jgi:hypothetical protein